MDTIIDSTFDNPDGCGWAMRTPNGLEIVRSAQNVDHVIGSFLAARDRWPNAYAVWHARFATHRDIDDANTHPFLVPGRPWALVHNGILPLSDGYQGTRSDTRIFAEDHVANMTWDELIGGKKAIELWMRGDKVVILPEHKINGVPWIIFNASHGQWDAEDGCWYSHSVNKSICRTCGLRWARCKGHRVAIGATTPGAFSTYGRPMTGWEEDLATSDADDEDENDYKEWWKENDPIAYAAASACTEDIDCECLDCEELRYWESEERREEEQKLLGFQASMTAGTQAATSLQLTMGDR